MKYRGENFGPNLKRELRKRKIFIKDFSEEVGICRNTLSNLVNGYRGCSIDTAAKIMCHLPGVKLEKLLEDAPANITDGLPVGLRGTR